MCLDSEGEHSRSKFANFDIPRTDIFPAIFINLDMKKEQLILAKYGQWTGLGHRPDRNVVIRRLEISEDYISGAERAEGRYHTIQIDRKSLDLVVSYRPYGLGPEWMAHVETSTSGNIKCRKIDKKQRKTTAKAIRKHQTEQLKLEREKAKQERKQIKEQAEGNLI